MLTRFRWWKVALGTLLAIFIGLFAVGREPYENLLKEKLVLHLFHQGLTVNIDKLSFRGLGAEVETVTAFRPRVPFVFLADRLQLSTSILSILTLSPEYILSGELYEGSLFAHFYSRLFGNQVNGFVNLEKVNLSSIPELSLLPVQRGSLTVGAQNLVLENQKLESGDIHVAISDFTKSERTELSPRITGLPLPIVIPSIQGGDLVTDLAVRPESFEIKKLSLGSSLLNVKGTLSVNQKNRTCDGSFNVELTPAGQKELGPFLSLLPGKGLKRNSSSFRLTVQGPLDAPSIFREPLV